MASRTAQGQRLLTIARQHRTWPVRRVLLAICRPRRHTHAYSPSSGLLAQLSTRPFRAPCLVPQSPIQSLSSANSHQPTSFPDPDRPDLFYHLFEAPNPVSDTSAVFALSFLPTPPTFARSSTVLGWLPADTRGEEEDAGLNDFVENPAFREVLHEAIQSALRDEVDDIQKNGAIQTQVGWMHIHDERNVPALGRIGDVDDILASVRVEDGEILADTYQPMPSYRLCTTDGITRLTEGLADRLNEVLEARATAERESRR